MIKYKYIIKYLLTFFSLVKQVWNEDERKTFVNGKEIGTTIFPLAQTFFKWPGRKSSLVVPRNKHNDWTMIELSDKIHNNFSDKSQRLSSTYIGK